MIKLTMNTPTKITMLQLKSCSVEDGVGGQKDQNKAKQT